MLEQLAIELALVADKNVRGLSSGKDTIEAVYFAVSGSGCRSAQSHFELFQCFTTHACQQGGGRFYHPQ